MKNNRNSQIVLAVIFLLLIVFYFIPIEIPKTVTAAGKLYSAKEWLLIKGPDGRLMTMLKNNKKGVSESYSVTQFERGDAIEFSISEVIKSGAFISANDTVGIIYSNETEKELIDLKSELAVESALLEVNLSTEKEAIVKSEEQRLEYAKRQLVEQEKLFRRQQALFDKNLISEEEFEVAKGAVELFRINVDIATERLKTVTTGAKEEEIDFIKSKIDGLSNQIEILQRRFSDFVIQSPIDGIVNLNFSSDTLLIISDTTEFIGLFPIHIKELKNISAGQNIEIEIADLSEETSGTIISIDKKLHQVNNNQYFVIAASFIKNEESNLLPGLSVTANISSQPITTKEHINHFFISLTK
jgi:hypothetical protein